MMEYSELSLSYWLHFSLLAENMTLSSCHQHHSLITMSNLCHFTHVEMEPEKGKKNCPKDSKPSLQGSQGEEPWAQRSPHGDEHSRGFSPPPRAAMRIPYSSQPTDCFSTINIQFGGGDGQAQMLDPKKPQSICSWPPKTEFLMS